MACYVGERRAGTREVVGVEGRGEEVYKEQRNGTERLTYCPNISPATIGSVGISGVLVLSAKGKDMLGKSNVW